MCEGEKSAHRSYAYALHTNDEINSDNYIV